MNIWVGTQFFLTGFQQRPDGKSFPYSKSFQLAFCSRQPKLYWLTPSSIGLSAYHTILCTRSPGRWRNTTVRKYYFLWRGENMLASKSKSVWCWVTELKLKQRLFFPIEVGGALTRGSVTNMLNKICPNKISQTLSWGADAPPSTLSFTDFCHCLPRHHQLQFAGKMVSKVRSSCWCCAAVATPFDTHPVPYFQMLHHNLWESTQISAFHSSLDPLLCFLISSFCYRAPLRLQQWNKFFVVFFFPHPRARVPQQWHSGCLYGTDAT